MMPATNIASDFDASTTPFPVAAIRDDNCLATCKHVVAPRPLVIIAQGMRPIAVVDWRRIISTSSYLGDCLP
jgi:hypothetical protein